MYVISKEYKGHPCRDLFKAGKAELMLFEALLKQQKTPEKYFPILKRAFKVASSHSFRKLSETL